MSASNCNTISTVKTTSYRRSKYIGIDSVISDVREYCCVFPMDNGYLFPRRSQRRPLFWGTLSHIENDATLGAHLKRLLRVPHESFYVEIWVYGRRIHPWLAFSSVKYARMLVIFMPKGKRSDKRQYCFMSLHLKSLPESRFWFDGNGAWFIKSVVFFVAGRG